MRKEVLGSQAFKIEYSPRVLDGELKDDLISYLWEYRFRGQKYDYSLSFSDNKIRDSHRGESMSDKAERAIMDNQLHSNPVHREKAELAGIKKLDDQLRFVGNDATVFWMSPPGPKEEGYGNYGFVYFGRVKQRSALEKEVLMTAIRVEDPSLKQFNSAFSALTRNSVDFKNPDDFLLTPFVAREKVSLDFVMDVLTEKFSFNEDKGEKERFSNVKQKLDFMIDDFMEVVRKGTANEKIKAFYAIENYALELKNAEESKNVVYFHQYRSLVDIIPVYGYKPPIVAGSCGSTGSAGSNDLLKNNYKTLLDSIFGENKWFTCPRCKSEADGPVGNKCPKCGLTKEEYAESGNDVC